jgi:hypothetical protein
MIKKMKPFPAHQLLKSALDSNYDIKVVEYFAFVNSVVIWPAVVDISLNRGVTTVAAPGFLAPGGKCHICYICRPFLGCNQPLLAPSPSGARGQLPPPDPLVAPPLGHEII